MDTETKLVRARPVQAYQLELECECGGFFVCDAQKFSCEEESKTVLFLHQCHECGKEVWVKGWYPRTESRPYGDYSPWGSEKVRSKV